MGFLKVCLYLAAIIGCGVFIVFIHDLPDPSPAPSSRPTRQTPARPHIRPIPKPISHDGGFFSDRHVLDHGGEVLGYGFLACLSAFLIWRGVTEYRDWGEWTAFIPLVTLAVIVGGLVSWFGFIGDDYGLFLIWPITVSLVVIALVLVRAAVRDRQRREEAEAMKQFDKSPVHGFSQEATPDDERRFGL